jgi:hypothetical protein
MYSHKFYVHYIIYRINCMIMFMEQGPSDLMVVGFPTICAISAFSPPFRRGVLDTTLCDKIYQWLATVPWFSLGTPVSSINITDCHNIAEILLKVVLNNHNPNLVIMLSHVPNPCLSLMIYCNKQKLEWRWSADH